MGARLVTDASVEPITLAQAKTHCRVEIDDDDDDITAYITAARIAVENDVGRALITQTWDIGMDAFPVSGTICLPKPFLQSITYIKYYDSAGDLQTWDSAEYIIDTMSSPGRIAAAYGYQYPITQRRIGAVIVRFIAGYGDAAADVPGPLSHTIKLIVANWYENREATDPSNLREVPVSLKFALAPYRILSV